MRQRLNSNKSGGAESGNRSEQVRQRREQRSQQRTGTAGRRVVKPARSQPVTVRGNLFGKPVHHSAGVRRSRRQFYVAMEGAGAELRLPAIPVLRPGWRLLSGLIASLAIFALYNIWTSPLLMVTAVELNGLERISSSEILDHTDLLFLTILEVDPRAVEATLQQAFPDLIDVQVQVALPNIVSLTAVEREPVAVWYQGETAQWLDASGTVFPIRGEAEGLLVLESETDLPGPPRSLAALAGGDKASAEAAAENEGLLGLLMPKKPARETPEKIVLKQVDPAFLRTAQELSQKMPAETTLLYDPYNGLGWYDERGWQVFIGRDLSTFESKIRMYEHISGYLNAQGQRPTLISVEHLNAPFYRLEQ